MDLGLADGDLDLSTARTGHLHIGEGRRGLPPERAAVQEYRFKATARRNGVALANAGAYVGVHRGGDVAFVRTGGVMASDAGPVSGVELRPDEVTEQIRANTSVRAPSAMVHIRSEGLLYAMPSGLTRALVAPEYFVEYSLVLEEPDGARTTSRRIRESHSVIDRGRAPTVWHEAGAPGAANERP